jgi:hypothetical protein
LKTASLCILAFLVLIASVSYGVEPSSKPTETTRERELQRSETEGGPLPFPEQMIVGEVTGPGDKPLAGVTVKLFADGTLVEVTHTTGNGAYEMPLPLRVEEDETVVLWFVATADDVLPRGVVLKKSSTAKGARLFSECALEAPMRPQMRVDVKLMTESETIASVKARGCL